MMFSSDAATRRSSSSAADTSPRAARHSATRERAPAGLDARVDHEDPAVLAVSGDGSVSV